MPLVRRVALGLVASAGLLLASVVPASALPITPGVPFTVELSGEAEVNAGGPTAPGPIVVHFSAYYVNVHNAEFPAGALRGQLDRPGL